MMNLLPAVLVGGPPHAGKSVLLYHIRHALRERGIEHYLLRACPDGEGNWFHEGEPELVGTISFSHKHKVWPEPFVQRISQDIAHRCLPFLVDMGGDPRPYQMSLFHQCTHSILLLRSDKPEFTQRWQQMVEENNLLPLARLFSEQGGNSVIISHSPVLEGTLKGLDRHALHADLGPTLEALIERIATLFTSYGLADSKRAFFEHASTELVLDLDTELRTFTTTTARWEPAMLPQLLGRLPVSVPLSVYGIGPNWLYAALSAHARSQPFYLFDPKLPFGWVQPAQVSTGTDTSPEIQVKLENAPEMTVLSISFANDHLDYFQLEPLTFPMVPIEKGLLIYGRVPYWLLTALTRLYKAAGVPWIAPYYVPVNAGVVAYSHVALHQPGDLVPKPNS